MPHPLQTACANRLLSFMAPDDFSTIQPYLETTPLRTGDVLIRADTPIPTAHFIEDGIVSCIAVAADGQQIELGLVGREGMVGVPILLDAERTPNEARVQVAGTAWSIPAAALREALRQRPSLHDFLLRYAQAVAVEVAATALANGLYKIERRLARWLLMCHDRIDGDVLPTTHRFLSLMLGVNRTGLTTVVAGLERAGIIETSRGSITIRDRDALLALAGAAYGAPEAEYLRLIGAGAEPIRPE
ncbi:hypothetical protein ASF39_03125 [Methylobacterium sp. Leaf108]|nr:hypothetical protein ASF39_03125 [Methylobacterium sp. Leaf108]